MSEGDCCNKDKLCDIIFQWVVTKAKLPQNVIDTFVKAVLYQPTNYMSIEEEHGSDGPTTANIFEQESTYLKEPPETLPSYLYEQFRHLTTRTFNEEGPEVATCVGAKRHTHKYLAPTSLIHLVQTFWSQL